MKEAGLRIRLGNDLREAFMRACKKDDLTAAQVLRAFMRSYIEHQVHGKQSELFGGALASSNLFYREDK